MIKLTVITITNINATKDTKPLNVNANTLCTIDPSGLMLFIPLTRPIIASTNDPNTNINGNSVNTTDPLLLKIAIIVVDKKSVVIDITPITNALSDFGLLILLFSIIRLYYINF